MDTEIKTRRARRPYLKYQYLGKRSLMSQTRSPLLMMQLETTMTTSLMTTASFIKDSKSKLFLFLAWILFSICRQIINNPLSSFTQTISSRPQGHLRTIAKMVWPTIGLTSMELTSQRSQTGWKTRLPKVEMSVTVLCLADWDYGEECFGPPDSMGGLIELDYLLHALLSWPRTRYHILSNQWLCAPNPYRARVPRTNRWHVWDSV